jgi:integrase
MGAVAPGVTFHRLRHRFGVMAYQATGDLLGVGLALGHSSPVSTAIYAQASSEVADRIAEAVVR